MESLQISLPMSTAALGSERFKNTLQYELGHLPAHRLPLQAGLNMGSHVEAVKQVMLLHEQPSDKGHQLRVGIFFTSVLAGCNCSDDPNPVDSNNEYLEIELLLDPVSAIATPTG